MSSGVGHHDGEPAIDYKNKYYVTSLQKLLLIIYNDT